MLLYIFDSRGSLNTNKPCGFNFRLPRHYHYMYLFIYVFLTIFVAKLFNKVQYISPCLKYMATKTFSFTVKFHHSHFIILTVKENVFAATYFKHGER